MIVEGKEKGEKGRERLTLREGDKEPLCFLIASAEVFLLSWSLAEVKGNYFEATGTGLLEVISSEVLHPGKPTCLHVTYREPLSGTHAPHSATLSFCPSLLAGPQSRKSDLRDFFSLPS